MTTGVYTYHNYKKFKPYFRGWYAIYNKNVKTIYSCPNVYESKNKAIREAEVQKRRAQDGTNARSKV
jgi:hypothetical protein